MNNQLFLYKPAYQNRKSCLSSWLIFALFLFLTFLLFGLIMGFFENPPERFADIASQAQCASLLGFFLVFYLLFISRPYYAYVELSEDELKFKKRWQTTAIINKQSIQQVTHNQFSHLFFNCLIKNTHLALLLCQRGSGLD